MNSTEKKARAWIAKVDGLKEEEIIFNATKTPDFILPDGTKYEVKFLYKDKIILYPAQLKVLRKEPDITVLVFVRNSPAPVFTIPASEIIEAIDSGRKMWRNIKLVTIERCKLQVFLPEHTRRAFDRYVREKYPLGSRAVSLTTVMALDSFLEKEGYLKKEVIDEVNAESHDE